MRDTINSQIEVEAKFAGGEQEFEQILNYLKTSEHFQISRKKPARRFHIYFDAGSTLREAGCRLRCVIAPGEWCRYDYKAEHESNTSLEVSVTRDAPGPLPEVINELSMRLPAGSCSRLLKAAKTTARSILTALGTHKKAVCAHSDLKLEVSWDVLICVETGARISEVEVELKFGERGVFERRIARLATELNLERGFCSKLDRLLRQPLTSQPPPLTRC